MMNIFERRPRWLIVMVIALMLPILGYPTLLSAMPPVGANVTLLKIYPFYVLFSGWCILMCYPSRRDMMWILIALVLLSHAYIWYLSFAS